MVITPYYFAHLIVFVLTRSHTTAIDGLNRFSWHCTFSPFYVRYIDQLKTRNSNISNVILLAYPFGKFGELVETVKFTCPCDVDGSKSRISAIKRNQIIILFHYFVPPKLIPPHLYIFCHFIEKFFEIISSCILLFLI